MKYHCEKLCGKECCKPLRWGLATKARIATGDMPFSSGGRLSPIQARDQAARDVCDPEKLADLLVMALRARGLYVSTGVAGLNAIKIYSVNEHVIVKIDQCACILNSEFTEKSRCWGVHTYDALTMDVAREYIRRVMSMPADESSADKALAIIRGKSEL